MRRAPATGILLAADKAAARDIGERGGLAVAERHIDVLAAARLGPQEQSSHDAVAGVQASGEVRDCDADLGWRRIPVARNVHQPELGLDHDVVARSLLVRSRLPISRDGRVHEARVDPLHRLVVQSILLQRPGEVILYQDVALRRQLM